MDLLPRVTDQLIAGFREMSFVQRAISVVFVIVAVAGFAGLFIFKNQTEFQPVSFGRVFGNEELVSAEKVLAKSGLTSFRRNGQRLLAPKKDLDRYNAVLLEFDGVPADLGTQMLKQYETLGPFSTDRHRQQMKEALLLQELRRTIKAVPEIEDARVAIASSERRTGWNHKPRANVAITPRSGREISATLINSLRHVVASMVPDLSPADVTIFDVTRGQAFTGERTDDAGESRYISQARNYARQCEQVILKGLSHIPHVGVVVHVDFEALRLSRLRGESDRTGSQISQVANRPATIDDPENHLTGFRGADESAREIQELSSLPKSMRVNVSIPRDYLDELSRRSNSNRETSAGRQDITEIEDELLLKVERTVVRLMSADSGTRGISVTFVDRLDAPSADPVKPLFKFSQLNPYYLWTTLFSLSTAMFLAWWSFHRSPNSRSNSEDYLESRGIQQRNSDRTFTAEIAPRQDHPLDRATTLREEIRALVQSDLSGSADLLGRWLSEAHQ